jgi:uncharacterized repeat protein (TIGR03803 family)
MLRMKGGVIVYAAMAVGLFTQTLSAQSTKTIVTFNGSNGNDMFSAMIQGADGNLYGTTTYGGASDKGAVFKISRTGGEQVLYSFCAQTNCTDGAYPEFLIQGADGNFYGETYNGGSIGAGSIFKMTPSGEVTTIYNFCTQANCADGALPQSALVQTSDGTLYGTTVIGGAQNEGTVFKLSPSGVLTTLYNFCSQASCADGTQPNIGLTLASDGNFYGTAALGGKTNAQFCGAYGCGTLFRITPSGTYTLLYSFCSQSSCADGDIPQGQLIQARDGSLYGTTDGGGANQGGTAFKVTRQGKVVTLHSFCTGTCQDGLIPYAGLIQASDGNFYGTDTLGGPGGYGTVYQMTPAGNVTPVFGFDDGADGGFPVAAVLQASDKRLYGGTEQGGVDGLGVVFQVSGKSGAVFDEPALDAETLGGLKAQAAMPVSPLRRRR